MSRVSVPASPPTHWVGSRRWAMCIGSVLLLFLLANIGVFLPRWQWQGDLSQLKKSLSAIRCNGNCSRLMRVEPSNQDMNNVSSAVWGRNKDGRGHSGGGSTKESTDNFRLLLEDFLRQRNIRSIVDAGCGDWEWTQFVDWRPVEEYIGVDVVPSVIARNQELYGSHNRTFHARSILEKDNLPPADLLMCKDVLQHLPTPMVHKFIASHLTAHDGRYKYKYALLTNDRCKVRRLHIRCVDNRDLGKPGGYRQVNLALPPFSLPALDFYRWPGGGHSEKFAMLMDFSRE
ncbi:unnamed protein product [Vitrella brassicaformis CCMP3155]|uniref:Methyltransferase domain-containing protein n=1 Tax=Vitrella brassicaformis (strain CCMP3155) TaxID=1169540 RepID=A0A0G4F238_VITBC|nr:unnamed protein product [Vitrella brassicaformis CCMP3155]|eukprot:CEM05594.1 unnamed protein product [Vitrella brassicaformis CCMP3155]